MKKLILALTLCLLSLTATNQAQAQKLVTDVNNHLIAIKQNFAGTELLLFGAVDDGIGDGDIIVVIRGPEEAMVVRKKDRVAGLWINKESVQFNGVPGYYAVASTSPVQQIASQTLLAQLRIGAEHIQIEPDDPKIDITEVFPFQEALIRAKQKEDLYVEEVGDVLFVSNTLFQTRISLPANVPVGNYRIEAYLIKEGEVISAQSTPLFINKTGVERAIFDFANQWPLFYGIAAVIFAVFSGWVAAVVFRKK